MKVKRTPRLESLIREIYATLTVLSLLLAASPATANEPTVTLAYVHNGIEHTDLQQEGKKLYRLIEGEKVDILHWEKLQLTGLDAESWTKGILLPRITIVTGSSGRPSDKDEAHITTPYDYELTIEQPADTIRVLTAWNKTELVDSRILSDVLQMRHLNLEDLNKDDRDASDIHLIIYFFNINTGIVEANAGRGWGTMETALVRDDKELLMSELEAGNNPNKLNPHGWAPVHLAATLTNDTAMALIEHKSASPRTKDDQDWLPLHYATARANEPAIKALIAAKSPLDSTAKHFRSDGNRPLRLAIEAGSETAVQLLLNAGAGIIFDDGQRSPMNQAIDLRKDNMVAILAKAPQRKRINRENAEWVLPGAIKTDRVEIVRYFLDASRIKIAQQLNGEWPILMAAHMASEEMLNLLVEYGAKLDATTESGNTALHIAAASNSQIISWLVEKGLDANAPNGVGRSPLTLAVAFGNVEGVSALLKAGADPNQVDPEGRHILKLATTYGRAHEVSLLVNAGATCSFTEDEALTILKDGFYYDIPEIFAITLDQCLNVDFTFPGNFPGWAVAERYNAINIQKLMIEKGLPETAQVSLNLMNPRQINYQPKVLESSFPPFDQKIARKYGNQTVTMSVIIDGEGRIRFPLLPDNPIPEMHNLLMFHSQFWQFTPPELPEGVHGVKLNIPFRFKAPPDEFELKDLDVIPKAIAQPAPVYPKHLLNQRVGGDVSLQFVVTSDGTVDPTSITVLMSSHEDFSDVTVKAISSWKFEPGMVDGSPVACRMRINIPFRSGR